MPTDNRNTAGRWGPSPWHDTATPPTDTQADSRPLSADAWPWSRPATYIVAGRLSAVSAELPVAVSPMARRRLVAGARDPGAKAGREEQDRLVRLCCVSHVAVELFSGATVYPVRAIPRGHLRMGISAIMVGLRF